MPAFSAFNVKAEVVHGLPIGLPFVLQTLAYAVLYVAALLVGSVTIFARREFR